MATNTASDIFSTVKNNVTKFDASTLGIPALVLLIMAMLVIPLPPLILDILFTFNILDGFPKS